MDLKINCIKNKKYLSPYYIIGKLRILKEPIEKAQFPDFIDKESINYIIKMTDLEQQIEDLKRKEKLLKQDYQMTD